MKAESTSPLSFSNDMDGLGRTVMLSCVGASGRILLIPFLLCLLLAAWLMQAELSSFPTSSFTVDAGRIVPLLSLSAMKWLVQSKISLI
jgi:hypothetical protein